MMGPPETGALVVATTGSRSPRSPGAGLVRLLPAPTMTSDNTRGALVMTGAMTAFTLGDACMKALGTGVPLFQILALRGLGISAFLLGLAALTGTGWRGWRGIARRDWGFLALRALSEMATAWLFLTALLLMPIANVSAIMQALPLTVTLAGALVLGDRVGWRRWAAIAVGFCGVLLIVRPGGEGFGLPSVLVLGSVLTVTLRDILSRVIAPGVPSLLVAGTTALGVTLFAGAGSAFVDWAPLARREAILLAGMMACVMAGYVASVTAMRVGEPSAVAPFRYTSLLVAIVLGVVVFGTVPDAATGLGAAIVVGSGLYALYRERRRSRLTAP